MSGTLKHPLPLSERLIELTKNGYSVYFRYDSGFNPDSGFLTVTVRKGNRVNRRMISYEKIYALGNATVIINDYLDMMEHEFEEEYRKEKT